MIWESKQQLKITFFTPMTTCKLFSVCVGLSYPAEFEGMAAFNLPDLDTQGMLKTVQTGYHLQLVMATSPMHLRQSN